MNEEDRYTDPITGNSRGMSRVARCTPTIPCPERTRSVMPPPCPRIGKPRAKSVPAYALKRMLANTP